MGSSMGGLISLYGLIENSDVFDGSAWVSTHWPLTLHENSIAFRKSFTNYITENAEKLRGKKLYFDYGTETLDAMYETHQLAIDTVFSNLQIQNLKYHSIKFEGTAHEENSWAKRVHQPLIYLLER